MIKIEVNLFKNKNDNDIRSEWINSFIKQLTERLKIMENEFIVDRFEGEYAVCENTKTKEMCNIEIEKLPENIKEGNVIRFENGKYIKDEIKEKEISDRIKEKMDDLWN